MPLSRRSTPLTLAVLAVAGLILVDTFRGGGPEEPGTGVEPGVAALPAEPPGNSAAAAAGRAAVRQRLAAEGRGTYIDSLLATTDSAVRRWDTPDGVLRYTFVRGGHGTAERIAEARSAMGRWGTAPAGLRFIEVADTAQADIVVEWTDRFTIRRAGQTDLRWDSRGRILGARVILALQNERGEPLQPVERLAVAVHEFGHALGLPHSADPADAMFESTSTDTTTARDRATLRLLYELPVGRVGEPRARRAP